MKTFRCVLLNNSGQKIVDLPAPDPLSAARQVIPKGAGPFLPRLEIEDERGHLYVAPAPVGGPASGRIRVFPLNTAA